ncbi:cytochrome c oxidase, subunit VIa [Catenaria anguillulae PL171]|uniref:Cytochrome c oxidase, subunit VIa n=1 Tax=Catenaria anguillulae PL171 TaxID=765915 RepID=A0A1Y2I5T2_9FUNG|nr:cytochrome c oxidase, subunit VIa [Catenaria anguillulae PL171]
MFAARLAPAARRFATVAEPKISEAGKKMLQADAVHAQASEKTASLWIKLTWFVGLPALALSTVNAYLLFKEHQEHLEHRELKFEGYPYMHIRAKRLFLGRGTKTAFHNPKVNAVPEE